MTSRTRRCRFCVAIESGKWGIDSRAYTYIIGVVFGPPENLASAVQIFKRNNSPAAASSLHSLSIVSYCHVLSVMHSKLVYLYILKWSRQMQDSEERCIIMWVKEFNYSKKENLIRYIKFPHHVFLKKR